ncbi:MAG TPA: glutathionylspermidine synthase family protein [Candidatus Paceibacterota bacterium]|nr:glutathionylspermidine synthase family protein [Verrucomicrobiota bacterium]HRY52083.1 glutathionylspermidine synthase family protein [Candidatus Paceibacterota bacterium]
MNLPGYILPSLPQSAFADLHRRAFFDCCKWDPQVEDVSILAPFPVILKQTAWREISRLAEQLADEILRAESELLTKPHLLKRLGFPRPVRKALLQSGNMDSREAFRVMRFDFHFTMDGWRISEANTDVPGGFNEASGYASLIQSCYKSYASPGDPADSLVSAIQHHTPPGGIVALAHATAYTDDRQVMVFLARLLSKRGLRPLLISPDLLRWTNGMAFLNTEWSQEPVDFIFRFFPGEWLPNLARACGSHHFFSGNRTLLANSAVSLLTQSKRFPLVWDDLDTPLPTWRQYLPETRDPRHAPWNHDEDWILKPVLGRVGDMIGIRDVTEPRQWRAIRRNARWFPNAWIAQRRFQSCPFRSDQGDFYPCFGVYTLNNRATGIYGRLARTPLVNHLACDAAVLIENLSSSPTLSIPQSPCLVQSRT